MHFHSTEDIMTNMTIARQRFDKHVPEATQSTVEGPPLLGSKSLSTYPPQRAVATKLTHVSWQQINAEYNTEQLFEIVISIRFALKL
jgi:hypothetical protein